MVSQKTMFQIKLCQMKAEPIIACYIDKNKHL
jgi:hypothetical protein